jgi:menaquinol-cytochrome c reductase iron-sulfur subunit
MAPEPDRFKVRSEWADQNAQASSEKPEFPGRRSFFAVLIGVGMAVIGALLGIPLIRFTIYPLLAKTTQTAWSKLGSLSNFSSLKEPVRRIVKITQVDGWREIVTEKPVYITRGTRPGSEDGIEVLSSICPHLGCEVPWNKTRGQFVCPCHNSVFAADGSLVSGPAPRGMDTLPIQTKDGDLQVRFEYFRQLVPDKEVMG